MASGGTQRSTRVVADEHGWRLVLPAGWASISTSAEQRDADVKRLLDRRFAGTARDELIRLRIDLDQRLKADVARAGEAGATQVMALVDPVDGLPVSATLVVAELTTTDDGFEDALARALRGDAGVLEVGAVEVAGRSAVRRRRRLLEGLEPDAPEEQRLWHTHLDYVIAVGDDTVLVLTFVTSTDPLADPLVAVFDSMAQSLHRADEPGAGALAWETTPIS